jgi:hypothetical protein
MSPIALPLHRYPLARTTSLDDAIDLLSSSTASGDGIRRSAT